MHPDSASDIVTLHRGTAPLLVSLPHDGSAIPPALAARMTPEARRAPDTDWHVSRLYAFARDLGASVLVPKYSRYVVDLNRPEDDTSLYPGQNSTGLCPRTAFTGEPTAVISLALVGACKAVAPPARMISSMGKRLGFMTRWLAPESAGRTCP